MKPPLPQAIALPLALAGLLAAASPAAAQLVVHDPTSYASLLRQAETALGQLSELKAQVAATTQLHDSFNTGSGAGRLAPTLAAPQLRAFLPDIDRYVAAAEGGLQALGAIGRDAADIRATQRLYTPPGADPLGRELERQGDRAARDLALGRQVAKVGAERLTGLTEVAGALDAAPNARAVLDLQTRLAAEQALISNDQMRLQGLAMAQAAEDRLQAQRERERAAAAADARMQLFRRGFP